MRIAGVELPDTSRVDYALTRIRGIGWTLSRNILGTVKIDAAKRVKDLTSNEVSKISTELEKYPLEGELARQVRVNIDRLKTISSYRGLRHTRNLPVRGQRTRTNARTKRGKRKTVGAFKKEVLSKMTTTETDGGKKE